MKQFIITITALLISTSLVAQYSSDLGRFEVDFIKGCAPLDITINNLDPANCPCDVRFGDGGGGQNLFSYTYTTPGTYTLEIDYQSLIPRTDFIVIEVVDNILPDFDILTCNNSQATIRINDTNFDQYSIDFDNNGTFETTVNQGNPVLPHTYPGPGSYDIAVKGVNLIAADNCDLNIKTITALDVLPPPDITSVTLIDDQTIDIGYTPQTDIVNRLEIATNNTTGFQLLAEVDNTDTQYTISNSNIDNENNYYCFRLGSYDACNNTSVYSPVICSVNLQLDILDGRNELDWNDGVAVINYDVCTNSNCNLTTLTSNYIDINAICNQDYCYQVQANYPNGAVSLSLEKCGTAFSNATPDAITNLIMERDLGQINLEWDPPVGFTPDQYSLRSIFQNEFRSLNNLSASPFLDIISNDFGNYCYELTYTDICGNTSPSIGEICSIYLRGTVQLDNTVELNWNAYQGYDQGVLEYRIEKYDQDGFLQGTFTTTGTSFQDNNDITVFQIARYKIFAVPNEAGLSESYSNEIKIIRKSVITHPRAFTPNGDGLNDVYQVFGTYIKTFNFKVYNRWGELLFVSNDISQGWDGTFKGKPLPSGSYAYSTEIKDLADRKYSLSGFFALIRK